MLSNEFQKWIIPQKTDQSFITGLKLSNSLWTQEKTEFVPQEGKKVTWYICGPTVYSDSHLGHAKTYLCFDTIRKILTRYFNYDVFQVMNITDIEDKIIKRALEENKTPKEVTQYWEKDFFDICGLLKIDPPNVVTRVTEFVPEIVEFIKKIISNGFAYESNGSVYFDVEAYQKDDRFVYPCLKVQKKVIENENQQPEENEEDNEFVDEKRNRKDFALWKKSKENEPQYESPWGLGRPGWHIECSVMCSSVIPGRVDIHSGGEDLKFPHHDNEIAQTQAHSLDSQWINYWLHTGHMNIKGQKMSKSLKNFIWIRSILGNVTPRILRIFFNLKNYDQVLNFNPDDDFVQARQIDKQFEEFFALVEFKVKSGYDSLAQQNQRLNLQEQEIYQEFLKLQKDVHEDLCENLQVPKVINNLLKFIKNLTKYILDENTESKFVIMRNCKDFIMKILHCIGLEYELVDNNDKQMDQLIQLMVDFRQEIREMAQDKSNELSREKLLSLSDKYREFLLKNNGIKIEDKSNLWKKVSLEQEKTQQETNKAKNVKEVKHPDTLYEVGGPLEKFKTYSRDENGLPDMDPNGAKISEKNKKFAEKAYLKQKKLYEEYLQKI